MLCIGSAFQGCVSRGAAAGLQQRLACGLVARMNALRNLPSTCGAMASTSRPASVRNVPGVFDAVGARGFEDNVGESRGGQLGAVVVLVERAGDAANPEHHALADRVRHFAADDDVGNGEAAAGLEHAERLAQDAVLVGGKIDDAVRDDHVDRIVGQRNVLDFAFEELDIRRRPPSAGSPGPARACRRSCRGHRLCRWGRRGARRAARRCRRRSRDRARSRPAGVRRARSGCRSRARRGRLSPGWAFLVGAVEIGGDGIAAAKGRIAACLQAAGLRDAAGGAAVFLLYFLLTWLRLSIELLLVCA